ncbi:hypothetical protein C453_12801 [Haloferax elongans ATCC BAA-1513]|uniref:Uncharacterized protein n=1 Tax=Haloferax elongans ATCC BAA-1513 TaxID=1230453 RepID=M0HIP6_HALEO|nr:hypothetical protein C453_12801 [Haloferax elongans ATCC BAA-1513]
MDLSEPIRCIVTLQEGTQIATLYDAPTLMGPNDERHMVSSDRGISAATWALPDHVFNDNYVELGVDADGSIHVWNVWDNVVHVVDADGRRERVERLNDYGGKDVLTWVEFVAGRRGWADLDPVFEEVTA